MRIEFWIEGRRVAIEAEGTVSFHLSEEEGEGRLGMDLAGRIAALRDEFSKDASDEADDVEGGAASEPEGIHEETEAAAEAELFSRLSALRRELASAAGVPPYVVFQDKSLYEMAKKRPKDTLGLSSVSGVGKARLEKYGEAFLSVIRGAVS